MKSEDAGMVAALVHRAFATQAALVDPPASAMRLTELDVRDHLSQASAGGASGGAVAMAGDGLVGSVMWSERDGGLYMERLAVDPDHRRRGIARGLIGATEQAGRARGVALLHLGTRLVLLDNRRLFAACGFVETSLHAHPGYAAPTWVRMEKVLA